MRKRLARSTLALLAVTLLLATRPHNVHARTVAATAQLKAFLAQCDVVVTGTVRDIQRSRDVPHSVICSQTHASAVNYDYALTIAVDSVRLGRITTRDIVLFHTSGAATPVVKVGDRVIAGGVYKSANPSYVFGSFTTAREMALGPQRWMQTHSAPWTPVNLDTLASQVAADSAAHPLTALRRAPRIALYRVRSITPCHNGQSTCQLIALGYPNVERGPDIGRLVVHCDHWCPLDIVYGDTLAVPVTADASSMGQVELLGCARSYKVQCGTLPVLGVDLPAALRAVRPEQH